MPNTELVLSWLMLQDSSLENQGLLYALKLCGSIPGTELAALPFKAELQHRWHWTLN